MLILPAPSVINGDILASALAVAGLPTAVYLVDTTLVMPRLKPEDEPAVQVILDAHPPLATAFAVQVAAKQASEATVRTQADAALDTNRTYVAIVAPTAAQTTAQVKALSRQANGLIRLALARFDGTN